MIEIFPNLYVGGADDEALVRNNPDFYVISAARDPWHREALGYTGRGAPKDHPEYFKAMRLGHAILNLVDAADPAYIPQHLMEFAVDTIHSVLTQGDKVLVHCNQGLSRSPTIALLYLHQFAEDWRDLSYEAAVEKFKTIYPQYAPAGGMAGYAKEHW